MSGEIDREKVKEWLKTKGLDREWLARQCGVTKGTVNNWLSAGRPIKGAPARIIASLMESKMEITPTLSLPLFQKLTRLAEDRKISVEELIAEIIEGAIDDEQSS